MNNDINNDLISRDYMSNKICDLYSDGEKANEKDRTINEVMDIIENAPTALFPLTVQVIDKVTDEDIENIKQLMKSYKPQILNLEGARPHGKWIFEDEGKGLMAACSECKAITLSTHGNFCPNCGADMRKGGAV